MKYLIFFLLLSLSPSAWAETKVTGNEVSQLHKSTISASMTDTTFTNTALSAKCVIGSTLTITTTGGDLMFSASGAMSNDTANQGYVISVVIDGVVVAGGVQGGTFLSIGTIPNSYGFSYVSPISSGTHIVCLTMATQAGTATFPRGGATPNTKARFSVMEIR